jgi:glycosyltransferase involved in cell wall biosynthesis
LSDQLDLNHRVVILNAMKPRDLAILYNSADVFVFPSERESFGLPPLEALACGTPTIAMNMSSLPEILGDGAVLIDGKDVQTWANAIEQVISDQGLRSNLIKRGLKQAAKMTWQQCAEETMKIYSKVIEET